MTSLENYLYNLPDHRIAKYPLPERDMSKLLKYQNGSISHLSFKNVVEHVPNDSLLVFNNTKVIAARMFFFKDTGAKIEIFLNEPIQPYNDFQLVLKSTNTCSWKCMVGNAKKWKDGVLTSSIELGNGRSISIEAELVSKEQGIVKFNWTGGYEFLQIIEQAGKVPLPPYLNRDPEEEDKERYQTVFSELEGAVAAPTAGLHFTDEIIQRFADKGIETEYVTLHVSAGTFRPIKEKDFTNHSMHNEKIGFSRKNINSFFKAKGNIIAVGTTAMRTLESIYWYGVELLKDKNAKFQIHQTTPYTGQPDNLPTREQSMGAILNKMNLENLDDLKGETEIFIYPGYEFKMCSGLFTNYHQPGSTLILLVAAFIGKDWKKVYKEALKNDYRFLSYGDTSLLFKQGNSSALSN